MRTEPTLNFFVEHLETENLQIIAWDSGPSRTTIRLVELEYLRSAQGIIFVVDSSDHERLPEAKASLKLLADTINVPLLVFANKQDIEGAKCIKELSENLDLNNLTDHLHQGRKWVVLGCNGYKGDGLKEGIDWLIQPVKVLEK